MMTQNRARLVAAASAIGVVLILAFGWIGLSLISGNIHEVVPGRLYRSATLDPQQLTRLIDRQSIRTIINLRGPHPGTPWWDAQKRVAVQAGIRMYDRSWSARRQLSDDELTDFLALIAHAEEPVLVHCMSGADRTGLAAALYLAAKVDTSEAAAAAQLSILYSHIGLPIAPAFAMDRSFERAKLQLAFDEPSATPP
ncbi:tyrosine-protein phosphatase [Fulvimarina sp. 2208YS6-2-32]|uniref:Tyrosine-protein phosphatase n=1 Tax=Fulvimarina uroteuthidis TaxID=3098149 RepID=A0ABU5I844_9HYPH|nr:tyrosine-protein phosphatase [Fulvimarina sp. 2208YS6-2-32]MDY8110993.1 tyrosine-protein phosphatase [Fulvimarina sp. 2208YS6-2-32]